MKYVISAAGMLLALPLAFSSSSPKLKVLTLSTENTVVLDQQVSDDSVSSIIGQLQELNSSLIDRSPIYLYLKTPGGSVTAGLELIEYCQTSRRPIHTITAFSASMGFQIAQHLGTRYILKSGTLMSHRAAGEMSGSFGGRSPSQFDKRYGHWLQIIKELDEQTVARTNGKQTMESYLRAYADEMWLTGQEAVSQGYADAVVGVSCDQSMKGTIAHQVRYLGAVIKYETSKCPIASGLLNIRISDGPPSPMDEVILRNFKREQNENSILQ